METSVKREAELENQVVNTAYNLDRLKRPEVPKGADWQMHPMKLHSLVPNQEEVNAWAGDIWYDKDSRAQTADQVPYLPPPTDIRPPCIPLIVLVQTCPVITTIQQGHRLTRFGLNLCDHRESVVRAPARVGTLSPDSDLRMSSAQSGTPDIHNPLGPLPGGVVYHE